MITDLDILVFNCLYESLFFWMKSVVTMSCFPLQHSWVLKILVYTLFSLPKPIFSMFVSFISYSFTLELHLDKPQIHLDIRTDK